MRGVGAPSAFETPLFPPTYAPFTHSAGDAHPRRWLLRTQLLYPLLKPPVALQQFALLLAGFLHHFGLGAL